MRESWKGRRGMRGSGKGREGKRGSGKGRQRTRESGKGRGQKGWERVGREELTILTLIFHFCIKYNYISVDQYGQDNEISERSSD